MNRKLDITSTVLEKGVDIAKDFLDKLILPSVEEAGLLLRDKVTFWKFKNQIKVLNKAKAYCERHKIDPKTISMKLLCPLLEYSALEEEDDLQDTWAILLGNMVDSEQNIQNHVIPYILSQISMSEFGLLNSVYSDKLERQANLRHELSTLREAKPKQLRDLELQIAELNGQITEKKNNSKTAFDPAVTDLEKKRSILEQKIKSISTKEGHINYQIHKSEVIQVTKLKDFELSNVIRLGLVKFMQTPYADSQTIEIPYDTNHEASGYLTIDLDVDVNTDEEYILTELGEMFFAACREKVS